MKEVIYFVGSLTSETLYLLQSYLDTSVWKSYSLSLKTFLAGVPRRKSDNAVCAGRAARDYDNVAVVSYTLHLSHQRKPGRNFATDETYHSFSQSGR